MHSKCIANTSTYKQFEQCQAHKKLSIDIIIIKCVWYRIVSSFIYSFISQPHDGISNSLPTLFFPRLILLCTWFLD